MWSDLDRLARMKLPVSNSSTRTVVVPVFAFESPGKTNQGNDQIRCMADSGSEKRASRKMMLGPSPADQRWSSQRRAP